MMYDELIKSLRNVADNSHYTSPELLKDAADAIENTSKAYQMMAEAYEAEVAKQDWIPVTERLPSDFVSVQAHMTDAGNFPPVREAYVVNGHWFFPALKEFHPVDMWRRFDEPPKEEA